MHASFRSLSCLAQVLVAGLPAQGEVDPRVAAKKGGEVWLVHEIRSEAKLELQGQELATSQRTARTLHLQVKDVDAAGNLVVETTIARVQGRLEMAVGQGEFDFDSAGAATDAPVHPMPKRALAGAGMKFVVKVSPAGEVLELGEGAAAVVDANKEGQGNMHQLTTHGLRQLVADAFGLLPHKRTAGGAKWERERLESLGRIVTRQKMALTLADVAPESFAIEGTGTAELAIDVLARDVEQDQGGDKQETLRQLKSTKVEKSRITCKQKTSREDGFVLQSSTEVQLDLVTSESQMGEVTTHMTNTTTVSRTTAGQALPKKDAAAKDKDAGKSDAGK